ncbi:hypothetical protein CLV58_12574 [Spirosoma oryzae]|uniref:Uncharacterized protein n=1 Tax=Spirosoma oryzae TaxID=1469603 RepID=A0A2T0S8T2_9BACT|nr:hypothetical protein [Spirosoma oryzae]PRY29812.1 hypothetical protein CLV58_12574 [Spirosoma oryzae]
MLYNNALLVKILDAVGRLTAAILSRPSGNTSRVKNFYDQSNISSGQSYQHNFQTDFGQLPNSYRLRVTAWDTDGYQIAGIRATPTDGNNAKVYFDDGSSPFTGDIQFYITTNP